jgi:hypothetical protein
MTSIYDRYNEREIAAYREGEQEARRFRANHGDIYQELFKAETDDYQLHVGYDDVELGTYISVTFKRRFDRDGCCKNVMVSCGGARKAIARAVRFIAQHPVEEPYCNVDY